MKSPSGLIDTASMTEGEKRIVEIMLTDVCKHDDLQIVSDQRTERLERTLLAKGVPPADASRMVGHMNAATIKVNSDPATSEAIYSEARKRFGNGIEA